MRMEGIKFRWMFFIVGSLPRIPGASFGFMVASLSRIAHAQFVLYRICQNGSLKLSAVGGVLWWSHHISRLKRVYRHDWSMYKASMLRDMLEACPQIMLSHISAEKLRVFCRMHEQYDWGSRVPHLPSLRGTVPSCALWQMTSDHRGRDASFSFFVMERMKERLPVRSSGIGSDGEILLPTICLYFFFL